MTNEVGLPRIAKPEAVELQPTLALRLFGTGNVVHDIVSWKGVWQHPTTYMWGITRCGMRGKTWDVETWSRGTSTPCKRCEGRRGT